VDLKLEMQAEEMPKELMVEMPKASVMQVQFKCYL
jgi:hypothetical protein